MEVHVRNRAVDKVKQHNFFATIIWAPYHYHLQVIMKHVESKC